MIITDIHAHVFPDRLADKAAHSIGDFYGTPMYSEASVDRLLAEDGEADISYSVICNSATRASSASARSIPAWTASRRSLTG